MFDPIAVIWVGAAVVGLVMASLGVVNGIADMRAVKKISNGRRIFAVDYLRSQALRLTVFIGWLYLGVPVLLDDQVTPLNSFTFVLTATNILLAVATALSYHSRILLLRSK